MSKVMTKLDDIGDCTVRHIWQGLEHWWRRRGWNNNSTLAGILQTGVFIFPITITPVVPRLGDCYCYERACAQNPGIARIGFEFGWSFLVKLPPKERHSFQQIYRVVFLCLRWQNPYQKSESKGMSQRTHTFTFLLRILPYPTLRTLRAGPVKKPPSIFQQMFHQQTN